MDALTDLFTMEDFRRPAYLVDWLSDALAKHKSGIFHLEMETGMGRSTFAQALDPWRCTGKMEISLEDTTVRGYCINASYLASEEAFCNSIPGIFNQDKDGARIFQASEVCLQYLRPGSPATPCSRRLSSLVAAALKKRDEKRIAEKLPVKELKFLRESAK